jgi:5-hydroxyisourate hydrolase-like protein (transthyretin family)
MINNRILDANNLVRSSGNIGSMTITVIDQQTGLPVPDITVFYILEKVRPYFIFEVKWTIIDLRKFKTDSNGKITIPAKEYKLGLSERLYDKSFFINLDTKNKDMADEEDMFWFKDCFSYDGIRENDRHGIQLVNRSYTATAVYFNNEEEEKKEEKFKIDYFRYDFVGSFDEKPIEVTVKLARNTGN